MPTQSAERQTLPVPEVARLLGVGRNTVYDAVTRGDIPAMRIGRRILVSRSSFDRLMQGGSELRVSEKAR